MIWFVIILIVMLIICISRLLRMKKDIQLLNKGLSYIQENNTNQQLTTSTFYKDICNLSNTMNEIIEKYKQIRILSEKANKEFQQAITNISHDLRTPLTSAIGYIQLFHSDKTSEIKKEEYLKIIEHRLKFLSNLTNNLLDYSRLFEGELVMKYKRININNLLRDIISTYYYQFNEEEYEVIVNIPDTVLYFMGDIPSFERIFMNLTQNALIYGTQIFEVTLNAKKRYIEFRNKIANPQDFDIEQILDRFYTADNSRNNKSIGLGLAIVKELVNRMGGSTSACIKDGFISIQIELIGNK